MSEETATRSVSSQVLSAPALYYCDLAHDAEPQLVLGYLFEQIQPHDRGLGLIARYQLGDEELACMDEIGRRLLVRPFEYLRRECERVWSTCPPGGILAALAASHYAALRIAPPHAVTTTGTDASTDQCVASALSALLARQADMGGRAGVQILSEPT